jgi:hypothetical protein
VGLGEGDGWAVGDGVGATVPDGVAAGDAPWPEPTNRRTSPHESDTTYSAWNHAFRSCRWSTNVTSVPVRETAEGTASRAPSSSIQPFLTPVNSRRVRRLLAVATELARTIVRIDMYRPSTTSLDASKEMDGVHELIARALEDHAITLDAIMQSKTAISLISETPLSITPSRTTE